MEVKSDICGKIDFWRSTWSRYTSEALDDSYPDEAPTVCSDECRKELDMRLKDGRVQLPRLYSDPGGFNISKGRIGY